MYTPFLGNRSIVNHTELQKVYDEIYSGSDSGEKPTIGMCYTYSRNIVMRTHFCINW